MIDRRRTLGRGGALLLSLLLAVSMAAPAAAGGDGNFESPPRSEPATQTAPVRGTAKPASQPATTCRIYGSSSGFGMLCSGASVGKTLAQLLDEAGIDVTDEYCWDDRDLPDGFEPPDSKRADGPGRWYLHTCLSFEGDVVRDNARLSYEFDFHAPGEEDELKGREKEIIELVTGRGQIPYLQLQATPISSPRVDQDIAFSMLCDDKVICSNTSAGREVRTPAIDVGGVTMFAELVHLKVLPEGAARPDDKVSCVGAGLPRTAEQLDATDDDDPRVCRWRYDRSSNDAGGGDRGDRYPAKVTAYWQIYYDEGNGPRTLGKPYEKTTVNQIRVTEVQTLVVS